MNISSTSCFSDEIEVTGMKKIEAACEQNNFQAGETVLCQFFQHSIRVQIFSTHDPVFSDRILASLSVLGPMVTSVGIW